MNESVAAKNVVIQKKLCNFATHNDFVTKELKELFRSP